MVASRAVERRIVANIAMLRALAALNDVVSYEATREAVLDGVPKVTEESNVQAFQRGYQYAKRMLGEGAEARTGETGGRSAQG
ncbi:MAG: hypothetical protein IMY86_10120 [Chloroflexi bacterium]|nr:hypothetical protein [Chloroflexota bacterium]